MSGQTGKDDPWHLYGYLDRNGRYYVGLSSNYEDAGEIALTVEQALELANLLVEEAKTGLVEQRQAKGDWEAEFRHPLNGLAGRDAEPLPVPKVKAGGMEIAPPLFHRDIEKAWSGLAEWADAEAGIGVDWEKVYEDEPEGL